MVLAAMKWPFTLRTQQFAIQGLPEIFAIKWLQFTGIRELGLHVCVPNNPCAQGLISGWSTSTLLATIKLPSTLKHDSLSECGDLYPNHKRNPPPVCSSLWKWWYLWSSHMRIPHWSILNLDYVYQIALAPLGMVLLHSPSYPKMIIHLVRLGIPSHIRASDMLIYGNI